MNYQDQTPAVHTPRVSVVRVSIGVTTMPQDDRLTLEFRDQADRCAMAEHYATPARRKVTNERHSWESVSRFLPADLGAIIRNTVDANVTPPADPHRRAPDERTLDAADVSRERAAAKRTLDADAVDSLMGSVRELGGDLNRLDQRIERFAAGTRQHADVLKAREQIAAGLSALRATLKGAA